MSQFSIVVKRLRAVAQDLSVGRVYGALGRRARDLPDRLAWHGPGARRNRERLDRFRDRHRGERCFILGNGPSLGRMDLEPLRTAVTFGANRVYLLKEKTGFLPTYLCCINELVLEQFAEEIAQLPMPKFLSWNRRRLFPDDERTMFVRTGLGLGDVFCKSPLRPLSSGGTVTYVSMQLAFFMGFDEVILVGVDHSFVNKGTPNRTEVRSGADENHFHPGYFPAGSRWQLPDLARSEIAYAEARAVFEEAGRRIVNATVGGKCRVFDRVEYESVVR